MKGQGKYFDGIRPFSTAVSFHSSQDLFYIKSLESDETLAVWRLNSVLKDEDQSVVVVLKNTNGKDRIEVLQAEGELPFIPKKFSFKAPNFVTISALLGFIFLLGLITWINLPKISQQLALMIPMEEEKKWASKLDLAHLNSWKFCAPPKAADDALKKVALRLYPHSPLESTRPLDIYVIDSPMVNAFTMVGGKIYLMKGLIDSSSSPEALAGVLAHEIEHIQKRHVTAMLIRSSFLTFIFHFLSGDFSSVFVVDPSTALSIASLTFDRDMETEADLGGLKRMKDAKINPQAFSHFFDHSLKMPKFLSFLSNHPTDEARIKMIKNYPAARSLSLLNKEEWSDLKNYCVKTKELKPGN